MIFMDDGGIVLIGLVLFIPLQYWVVYVIAQIESERKKAGERSYFNPPY